MNVDENKFICKELRAVFEDTRPFNAASILLNLTDYSVIAAANEATGRQVLVAPTATEATYPSCGVLSTKKRAEEDVDRIRKYRKEHP